MNIYGFNFDFICDLAPENAGGAAVSDLPRKDSRIDSAERGHHSCCRFRIPAGRANRGVYVLTVGNELRYVGSCQSLADRFDDSDNQSPRRKQTGDARGRASRIDRHILAEARKGRVVKLWFLESSCHKQIERIFRRDMRCPWNGAR